MDEGCDIQERSGWFRRLEEASLEVLKHTGVRPVVVWELLVAVALDQRH